MRACGVVTAAYLGLLCLIVDRTDGVYLDRSCLIILN